MRAGWSMWLMSQPDVTTSENPIPVSMATLFTRFLQLLKLHTDKNHVPVRLIAT